MSKPWFRMYHEFVSDPKVQLLAFEDQRHFVALLCLKCNETLDSATPSDAYRERMIAKALGLSPDVALEAKRRLLEVGLIDETWQPVAWENRQYDSDTSTERTRRYREKLKETSQERHKNVTVTDKIRTEQIRTDKTKTRDKRAGRRVPEDFKPDLDFAVQTIPDVDAQAEAAKFKDWEFKTPRSDWSACWRTWVRNAKDRGSYAKKPTNGLEGVRWL